MISESLRFGEVILSVRSSELTHRAYSSVG